MHVDGMRLGPYRLEQPLRDAQVGEAFIGSKPGPDGFEKRVVVRCVPRESVAVLVAEANRAARLSHAGIAHVLDVGAHEDFGYVVAEHARGVTLRSLVEREGRLPWKRAARMVSELAAALSYAHTRRDDEGRLLGLVHGRIHPKRIVLHIDPRLSGPGQSPVVGPKDRFYGVKLTGMGTSWAWPDAQGFGSPEETRGEPIDGRADVYSLGLVLADIVDRNDAPVLAPVVERATDSLQERRYTARELGEALTDALREAGLTERAPGSPNASTLRL